MITLVAYVAVVCLVLGVVLGLLAGLYLGELRLRRAIERYALTGRIVEVHPAEVPQRILEPEEEAATAIAPPVELIQPKEIAQGADALLKMAKTAGIELSPEQAHAQATQMLMEDRGILT